MAWLWWKQKAKGTCNDKEEEARGTFVFAHLPFVYGSSSFPVFYKRFSLSPLAPKSLGRPFQTKSPSFSSFFFPICFSLFYLVLLHSCALL